MSKRIKVVVDDDIPFIKGVLEPYATVFYYRGNRIGSQEIKDADALIIRTRTKCDALLLNGSKVKFIASATIGSDHVDQDYCAENGISFTNAAGCNAWAVVQYVLTAIFTISANKGINLSDKKIGIIGAGNVGERLASTCESLGFKVFRCDPPVKKMLEENLNPFDKGRFSVDRSMLRPEDFYSMDEVIEKSDIITVHLPLISSTREILNNKVFSKIKPDTVFINSSRGEVLTEQALIDSRSKLAAILLDVWSNEPNINLKLLELADIATPHIAGYSLEGKINATVIAVNKFAGFFGIKELSGFNIDYPVQDEQSFNIDFDKASQKDFYMFLQKYFPIMEEDKKLRANPMEFESVRSRYLYRREITKEMYKLFSGINS